MKIEEIVKQWDSEVGLHTFNFVSTPSGYALAVLPKSLGKKNGTVLPQSFASYVATDLGPTIEDVFDVELLSEFVQIWYAKTQIKDETYFCPLHNVELMFEIIDATTDRCTTDKDFFRLLPEKEFWSIARHGIVGGVATLKSNQWIKKLCNTLLYTEFTEVEEDFDKPFYLIDGIFHKSIYRVVNPPEPSYPKMVKLDCKGIK